jgi:hypothetical protein
MVRTVTVKVNKQYVKRTHLLAAFTALAACEPKPNEWISNRNLNTQRPALNASRQTNLLDAGNQRRLLIRQNPGIDKASPEKSETRVSESIKQAQQMFTETVGCARSIGCPTARWVQANLLQTFGRVNNPSSVAVQSLAAHPHAIQQGACTAERLVFGVGDDGFVHPLVSSMATLGPLLKDHF